MKTKLNKYKFFYKKIGKAKKLDTTYKQYAVKIGKMMWAIPIQSWMKTLVPAAKDHLSMFAKATNEDKISKFIIKEGIPLILFPRCNVLQCEYLVLCVGASWSDNDFVKKFTDCVKSNELEFFRWAKGMVEQFQSAVTSGNEFRMENIAVKWLEGCSTYFDQEKPCWSWFCRMLPFLDGLRQQALDRKVSLNWMFNDLILFPTKALGLIKDLKAKRRMYSISKPVWEKYLSCLTAKKSIVLFVSGSTEKIKVDEAYIKSKIPLVSVIENVEKKIVHPSIAKPGLYDLKYFDIVIKGREQYRDKLFYCKGFQQWGHPILSKKTYTKVAEHVAKCIFN